MKCCMSRSHCPPLIVLSVLFVKLLIPVASLTDLFMPENEFTKRTVRAVREEGE